MESAVYKLINMKVKNVDKYVNNGSTWLIFTDRKQWVIELTKEGTLWYNYNFFKAVFSYFGLDVVENQHYITKWVEDNVIRDGVKVANKSLRVDDSCFIQDTIENGVKQLRHRKGADDTRAENIIQNGVKHTERGKQMAAARVENTIQNGVKVTLRFGLGNEAEIEDTIQNGIQDTRPMEEWVNSKSIVDKTIKGGIKETNPTKFANFEDAIENGIKNTYSDKIPNDYDWSDEFESDVEDAIQNGINMTMGAYSSRLPNPVENVIKNGVKECVPVHHMLYNPMDFSVVYRENHRLDDVTSVLENGIKEVQPLPAQDGNMDWGNYYHRQEDRTKPHTEYVKDVIDNGSIIG